jgi:hypothetical protein
MFMVSWHRLGGRGRMTDETPHTTPGLNRRMLLRGGLLAGFGVAVAGVASPALTGVAQAATAPRASRSASRLVKSAVTPDTTYKYQGGWAYCANCAGLWYTGNNTTGWCPFKEVTGGGGHIESPSYSYELQYDLSGTGGPPYQPGWNWCSRCQGLFYATNMTESYCPAKPFGGRHNPGGFAYSVRYSDAVPGSVQGNWFWCGQCQGLFQGGSVTYGGDCPYTPLAYNGHNAGTAKVTSNNYDVIYYSTTPP